MRRLRAGTAAAVFGALLLAPVLGGAFVPLGEVAPVGDLDAEARAQLTTLEGLLKESAAFDVTENRKKKIPRAAGVIAVMGQAIAEHPDKSKVKVAGPDLRDAARRVIASKSHEEAVAALGDVKRALAGESTGKAVVDHPWNKLMSLHRLMEEVDARQTDLRKVYTAVSKGKEMKPGEGAVDASTMAVLSLVVYADTHEVKKTDEIPQWQEFSKQFRKQWTELSQAMHKGDGAAVKRLFPAVGQSCTQCHDQFRP